MLQVEKLKNSQSEGQVLPNPLASKKSLRLGAGTGMVLANSKKADSPSSNETLPSECLKNLTKLERYVGKQRKSQALHFSQGGGWRHGEGWREKW